MENKEENMEKTSVKEDILPGYKSVADFTMEGFKCLIEGTKHANSLPIGRDWNFYSTFESFTNVLKEESEQIVGGITALLKKNEVGVSIRNQTLEKKTEIIIDANDIILERVANNIDEMNGIKKNVIEAPILHTVSAQLPANINGSWNRSIEAKFSVSSLSSSTTLSSNQNNTTIRLLTAENIIRPQKLFKDKIDNRNNCPWEPRIKDKPNSLKPLAIFLEQTEHGTEYSHPYEYELDRFNPSDQLLSKTKIDMPKSVEDTPLVEINLPEQLPGLLEDLRKYKTIAVDLEHHSYRSFMGITCLMQISTPEKDYIIDTLALRNDLWILNEIFTKPDITKVFHGADSDVTWLQRDLSLYVVNMFDTYFGAKQLEYSGLSLAYLMQRFCSLMPNKQFQLADWRIRPLPEELKNYAREDTHYLIYIYQNMRNELIDKANGQNNLLKAVIDRSTTLCKKKYVKPMWNENSHLEFYRRCHRVFDNRQMYALKEIYKWRDQIARIEDESIGYVLPNNMLLEIAGRLPKEMQGILACCSPVPPLVRANLMQIHKIILKALEKPYEEPILKEDIRARGSTKKMTKINVDSPLHCPHDVTRNKEFRDDLPTLLNSPNKVNNFKNLVLTHLDLGQKESVCSVFNISKAPTNIERQNVSEKLRKFKENFKFLSPYERYKLVKPFIEAKEKKAAEEKAKEDEAKADDKEDKAIVEEDNRTDEERIESIREHFLQLSRKALPPQPEPSKRLSLLEMGGTKKRKRDESFVPRPVNAANQNPSGNSVHTPLPKLQITLHTDTDTRELNESGGRKRKSDGNSDSGPSKFLKFSRREKNKMNMVKRKQKKALAISSLNNDNKEPHNSQILIQRGPPKSRAVRGRKNFRGQPKGRKPNLDSPKKQQNQTEDFNAYDYSMVDFRQFQGGAKGVNKSKEFKTKFKGKGKPNKRGGKAQYNKALSFDRGRGK